MAKAKKTGARKMPATAEKVRHARIELPDSEYQRLQRMAKSLGLGVAAYIRLAVMRQLRRDEEEMTS